MTKEGDIYSAGIIIQEIMTRSEPYQSERSQMDIEGNSLTPWELPADWSK